MEVSTLRLLPERSKVDKWPDYPVALDIVFWHGKKFQLAAVAQTQSPRDSIYIVSSLENKDEQFRIKGAKFERSRIQDPPKESNYIKEESVVITGKLVGGKRQES